MAFCNNGKLVVSAGDDLVVRVWNLATGELTKILRGHKSCINSVAVSSKDEFIVSGSWDNKLIVWVLSFTNKTKVFDDPVVLSGQ